VFLVFTGENVKVGVYVDDLLGIGEKDSLLKIKEKLAENMTLKDLGAASRLLSINVRKINGVLTLNQTDYITSVLNDFGFSDCKPVTSPFALEFGGNSARDELIDSTRYRSAVGSLLYIANCTRPDIFNAVCKVSRKSNQ